jgi:hypothetical protein
MFGRVAAVGLLLVVALPARGHDGPPFPIFMDEKVGTYRVSVWTDPDVGIGTFFVIIEPPKGEAVDEGVEVRIGVRPTSGRLAEAWYTASRQELRGRVQYYAEVEFDAQEMWKVRIAVKGPGGERELATEVEATPPGLGRWDLCIYLFPFLLLAGLWAYGVLRYRARRKHDKVTR